MDPAQRAPLLAVSCKRVLRSQPRGYSLSRPPLAVHELAPDAVARRPSVDRLALPDHRVVGDAQGGRLAPFRGYQQVRPPSTPA